jgi:hypothetical protein
LATPQAQHEVDEISPEIDSSSCSSHPPSPRYSQLLLRRLLCCFRSHKVHAPKTAPIPAKTMRAVYVTTVPSPPLPHLTSLRHSHPNNRVSINGRSKLLNDLPPPPVGQKQKKCLVLDLDETLVHSSFQVPAPQRLMSFVHPPALLPFSTSKSQTSVSVFVWRTWSTMSTSSRDQVRERRRVSIRWSHRCPLHPSSVRCRCLPEANGGSLRGEPLPTPRLSSPLLVTDLCLSPPDRW